MSDNESPNISHSHVQQHHTADLDDGYDWSKMGSVTQEVSSYTLTNMHTQIHTQTHERAISHGMHSSIHEANPIAYTAI